MHRIRLFYLMSFIFVINVKCEQKEGTSKKLLPYFRRKVEELGDDDFFETTESDDPHKNIVSFLVNNVREIFDDLVDNPEIPRERIMASMIMPPENMPNATIKPPTLKTSLLRPSFDIVNAEAMISSSSSDSTSTLTDDVMLDENLPLTTLLDKKQERTEILVKFAKDTRADLQSIPKNFKYFSKNDKKERDLDGYVSVQPYHLGNGSESDSDTSDPRRSCIMCNNVDSEDCNDPKNKLIPSVMCERDDDLCYSLHTPFGIIDRGCFNVNHNLTTYICSCNLCNYISISEMPFMFTNKRDWVDNIIELSRTKHFRKSVFKDMSCLRCEVNTTTKTGDMLDSANCLEGNIGNLPIEECDVDEVCAVRALRADGYIWRGCIKTPLYNYWWAVCDHDLCNYDTIVSLHDFILL